jgi:Spy/CpxP family protein refolding chaperone
MKVPMIRGRWLTPALLAVAVGLGGMAAGCGAPADGTAPQVPAGGDPPVATMAAVPAPAATSDTALAGTTVGEDEDESTADLKEHHRHHHHGGFAMFVAMSLDTLGTTPEQSASITKIQADLHAKMLPAHDAEKNVLSVLADGIAAGKIDQAKVDAAVAAVGTAAAGVHDAVADSMNQLHTTLTPPQRAALVSKVEAHLDVWHHANAAEEPAEKDAHGGHLGKLAKDLGLSADQVEKARAAFKASMAGAPHFDRAEADAHVKAFGTAFASDTFDARKVTTGGPANAHLAAFGVTRMTKLYEAVTPVLTADQRAKLADALRRHANYKRTPAGT